MREPFAERAALMGLDATHGTTKGLYTYSDQYSEIAYRQLYNGGAGMADMIDDTIHPTDGLPAPMLAIYTRKNEEDEFKYVGHVSELYKFIGNDMLCQQVRGSIQSVGIPIVSENPIMNQELTRLRNEIVIEGSQGIPQAGDVLPVMVVSNSYNGTGAASFSFGIAMDYQSTKMIFAFSLGEIKQVHIDYSGTEIRSALTTYMGVFSENIVDMIGRSFDNQVSELQMLAVLDVIEQYGKKRRDAISSLLEEIQPASAGLPSSWQVFLAIVRYSSFEKNLNIKKLLENAAESVLVIPPRMYDVLSKL